MKNSVLEKKINEAIERGKKFPHCENIWFYGFSVFYNIRRRSHGEVGYFLQQLEKCMEQGGLISEALWLWCASEAASAGNREFLDQKHSTAETVILHIEKDFDQPYPNWIDIGIRGFYVTNLALFYAAVSSYKNASRSAAAAVVLQKLKSALFQKFMEHGRLKSREGGETVFADIVLCSVPFGLMDAGNQIMVETVEWMEKKTTEEGCVFSSDPVYFGRSRRKDLECLMAWYYSERGEMARAKKLIHASVENLLTDKPLLDYEPETATSEELLLEHQRKVGCGPVENPTAYVLLAIVLQNIERLEGKTSESGLSILHQPEGNGSQYHAQPYARLPLIPAAGEAVILRAVVKSFDPGLNGWVCVRTGDGVECYKMHHVGLDGEEGYWEANIGSYPKWEQVFYRIIFEGQGIRNETEEFAFTVYSRESVTGFAKRDTLSDYTVQTHSFPEGLCGLKVMKTKGGIGIYTDRLGKTHNSAVDGGDDKNLLDVEMSSQGGFRVTENGRVVLESFNGYGLPGMEFLVGPDGDIVKFSMRIKAAEGEEYYGLGERYKQISYKGERLDCYVFNQYRDQGYRTYMPIPFFQSSAGYGVRLLTSGYSVFGFQERLEGLVELEAEVAPEKEAGAVFYSGTPYDILRGYLLDTAMPKIPPRWAFGLWMSSNNWDRQDLTLEQARITRELGIPATVLVLEQWSDEATFYIFNDAVYENAGGEKCFQLADFTFPEGGRWPDPKGMVAKLHEAGLKVLLWQAPVMKYMDGIPHAQRDEDEQYMLEKGYCIRHSDGKPYRIPDFEWFKRSLVPDFTNPDAREWWLGKRRYLLEEIGIDGFKTDGGECIYGKDVIDSTGKMGNNLRNAYPVDYITAFHEYACKYRKGDAMTFSRAGYEGAQQVPAHWAGDERSTFEAFRTSIRAGLSAGISGIPFWGWDLGGFNGDIPTAELFIRSTAMAAFCPIMQYHAESKGEKNRDRTPWNIAERAGDPEVLRIFRHYSLLRMNLLPYIWREALHSGESGEPMMRMMYSEFPDEPALKRIDDQYMFGRALLVAPVVYEGERMRKVVLPRGHWYSLLKGVRYEGAREVEVEAPLDSIPVFVRADRLVPLNLPEGCEFPGDVGNETCGYKKLCLLFSVDKGLDESYTCYDGGIVQVKAVREGDTLSIEVGNSSNRAVVLLVDSGRDSDGRRRIEVGQGNSRIVL